MARKSKTRGLDKALDELFANYEASLIEAMKYAAKEARADIKLEVESCLGQYYSNYDPTSYDRTRSLFDAFELGAFVPYKNVRRNGSNIVADAGVGYWPMMLDGLYTDGSNQWRPVDGWWILDNYLKGIHPATDGSSYIGAPYTPHFDGESESPNYKMKKYLEEYGKTFNNNLLESFAKQITRR